MAKPIAETPILHGKDAEKFGRKIKYNETHPVDKEEYERIMKIYHSVKIK